MGARVLLVASKTGYQLREFYGAAERLGIELTLVTDRCHILDDPWGDQAAAVQFERPEAGIQELEARGAFDGVIAVGDQPAGVAARIAERLRLRFHSTEAVRAASDKYATRERFRAAGLNVPSYGFDAPASFPCVLKPLHLSASRGVIRADNPEEFAEAHARIRKMIGQEPVLVEDFIPGREFALEGIVTGGRLQTLAIFDKPDPLDGPFFEETIYLTPSGESAEVRQAINEAAQSAVTALGLTHGPVHAEMRVNPRGVWMLEAAARPIGGLCSRILRFVSPRRADDRFLSSASAPAETGHTNRWPVLQSLEDLLLLHALGRNLSSARLAPGAHGVMMIPIPREGVYSGVDGLEKARETADIESVEITAKEGQYLAPLPEGQSYLGFIFSRASSRDSVDRALRHAHSCLRFRMTKALPVVR
jgi:glutathione synthase/RimK-type ligase-like ATP-grasp enzyme